jgi:hypothetical protein
LIQGGRFEKISKLIVFAEEFLHLRPKFLIVATGLAEKSSPLSRWPFDGTEKNVPHATPRPGWNLCAHAGLNLTSAKRKERPPKQANPNGSGRG